MIRISEKDLILNQFSLYWEATREEFFKLETKQFYKEDDESYDLYVQGRIKEAKKCLKQALSSQKPFYAYAASNKINFVRIHICEFPLTNYIKYEIEAYKIIQNYGEKIFIVINKDQSVFPLVNKNIRDFLLFDEKRIILQEYNDAGEIDYAEVSDDIEEIDSYIKIKTELLQRSVPLKKFIEKLNRGDYVLE